ncbi:hypothetical protein [Bacillus sp. 166amftsu]|nr:hypothetical protein [Bacillus sp. 166amftsu]
MKSSTLLSKIENQRNQFSPAKKGCWVYNRNAQIVSTLSKQEKPQND